MKMSKFIGQDEIFRRIRSMNSALFCFSLLI